MAEHGGMYRHMMGRDGTRRKFPLLLAPNSSATPFAPKHIMLHMSSGTLPPLTPSTFIRDVLQPNFWL